MGQILAAAVLIGALALGLPNNPGRPQQKPPAPQARTIPAPLRIKTVPESGLMRHPMAIRPSYPIPDAQRYPGKFMNGVEFHFVPVAK